MTRIGTFPLLIGLGAASWAVPAWEYATHGMVSIVSVVTATMFTAMVAAWPFLNGRRVHHARVEKAVMCRDCRSLRWPSDLDVGFCIHCGSMRAAIPVVA